MSLFINYEFVYKSIYNTERVTYLEGCALSIKVHHFC